MAATNMNLFLPYSYIFYIKNDEFSYGSCSRGFIIFSFHTVARVSISVSLSLAFCGVRLTCYLGFCYYHRMLDLIYRWIDYA